MKSLARPLRGMQKGLDFVGVCVVYFCHDGNGRFVMNLRNANCRDEHGCWDIGGGGVEHGDSIEDSIRREIREEYCTDVIAFEFLGYRDVHREHESRPTHWIALDFKVHIDPTQVQNGEPHKADDIQWFTLETIPENVHSQFPHFIDLYREKLERKTRPWA